MALKIITDHDELFVERYKDIHNLKAAAQTTKHGRTTELLEEEIKERALELSEMILAIE